MGNALFRISQRDGCHWLASLIFQGSEPCRIRAGRSSSCSGAGSLGEGCKIARTTACRISRQAWANWIRCRVGVDEAAARQGPVSLASAARRRRRPSGRLLVGPPPDRRSCPGCHHPLRVVRASATSCSSLHGQDQRPAVDQRGTGPALLDLQATRVDRGPWSPGASGIVETVGTAAVPPALLHGFCSFAAAEAKTDAQRTSVRDAKGGSVITPPAFPIGGS